MPIWSTKTGTMIKQEFKKYCELQKWGVSFKSISEKVCSLQKPLKCPRGWNCYQKLREHTSILQIIAANRRNWSLQQPVVRVSCSLKKFTGCKIRNLFKLWTWICTLEAERRSVLNSKALRSLSLGDVSILWKTVFQLLFQMLLENIWETDFPRSLFQVLY